MARFECATCKLAPADRAAVESKISAGMKYRDLSALTGISKSALHRHATVCMGRERLRELKARRMAPAAESRTIVRWPDGNCMLGSAPFNVAEIGPEDFLIVIQYAGAVPPREYGKFDAEEVPESILAADDVYSDAAPCEEIENRSYPVTSKSEREPVTAAENKGDDVTFVSECSHIWRDVAVSVTRCEKCGEQKPVVQVVGISRKAYAERNRDVFSRRPTFGRF